MATWAIETCKDKYKGGTGAVVGTGPSILNLTPESFLGVQVAIVLGFAIIRIRTLNLSIPIYFMEKDHGSIKGTPDMVCNPCPGNPPCRNICIKEPPKLPELYLIHEHESKYCNDSYPYRYLFDNEKFGQHYGKPSVVSSIEIMHLFGVEHIKMMGFDSITIGSLQTCRDGVNAITMMNGRSYLNYVDMTKNLLKERNFKTVEFIQ